MSSSIAFRRSLATACPLLLSLSLLCGCSDAGTTSTTATVPSNLVRGNWQISSTDAAATALPALSGSLGADSTQITATLHAKADGGCLSAGSSFALTGTADQNDKITLTGAVGGGTLTLSGTLAADGRSLTGASYNVVGGSCGFTEKVTATAQAFSPISGSYAGNFADADGQVAQVTAILSQSPTSDADGNFTLSGSATVSDNPCFPNSVPVSNTQVTGGSFTFTYGAGGNTVTAHGTFSQDASTLAVTSWTSSGTCGADTGVASSMARQGS